MKTFRLMVILVCAVIISLAMVAKELCHREINLTNGGQFGLGYSGYGETYCAISGFFDPVTIILGGTLLTIILFQLLRAGRCRAAGAGEPKAGRPGGTADDIGASNDKSIPPGSA
jgi:hypothetical protein